MGFASRWSFLLCWLPAKSTGRYKLCRDRGRAALARGSCIRSCNKKCEDLILHLLKKPKAHTLVHINNGTSLSVFACVSDTLVIYYAVQQAKAAEGGSFPS